MSRTVRLALIPGDGIGPEVMPAAVEVVHAALAATASGVVVDVTEFDLGARRWHATGEVLPDSELAALREYDAILLGAVGDPSVPSGVLERGLLLKLRFALDHYVNLRPARIYPGVGSPLADPGEVDFVVVREGTEGPYTGNGGALRVGTPAEVATEVSVNTAFGVERVVAEAFRLARTRPRHKLTWVHKHNVLTFAGDLWRRTVARVAEQYPDIAVDYLHVDAATMALVSDPARFDVIVTDNLFGDIITDLAASVTGGVGLAASGNVNPDRSVPSMFEPVHGSAPDIAGKDLADPTAMILSVVLLLQHLGLPEAAQLVADAVEADLAERAVSEAAGRRGTRATGEAILAQVRSRATENSSGVSPAADNVRA